MAAIVDEKIFCMHGGLSPELNDMDQIKRVLRPTDVPDTGVGQGTGGRVSFCCLGDAVYYCSDSSYNTILFLLRPSRRR